MKKTLVLGPPGTGKTTHLLNVIDGLLSSHVRPERIAYFSFTNKATDEAVNRAVEKFKFRKKDLPYFRTIHSTAWRALQESGYTPSLMLKSDWYDFSRMVPDAPIWNGVVTDDSTRAGVGLGDIYLHQIRVARSKCIEPVKQVETTIEPTLRQSERLERKAHFQMFFEKYQGYLVENDKVDFPDLLDLAMTRSPPIEVDYGIVDEAQDLSLQQWKLVWHLLSGCQEMYIAGDDDQAIFEWSGADLHTFRHLGDDPETTVKVLEKSWRLPVSVFDVGADIVSRISDRYPKKWHPRPEQGLVKHVTAFKDVPLDNGRPWLVLSRNNKFLRFVEDYLRAKGQPFVNQGNNSVNRKHLDAIYAWTAISNGREVTPIQIRAVYAQLATAKDGWGVKRGFLDKGQDLDDETGDWDYDRLVAELGLLIPKDAEWFKSLSKIPQDTGTYYRRILRHDRKLLTNPVIELNTIHGAKGGECENVLLLRTMSKVTWESFERNPDSEHRTFYVGVTRAKLNLYVALLTDSKFGKYNYRRLTK